MSELKLNCPHCEQSLELPDELLGQAIECPSCEGTIQLPDPDPVAPEKEPPAQPTNKQKMECPFCSEEILAAARKCKHCGEFLDGSSGQAAQQPSQTKATGKEKTIWVGNPAGLYYLGHWIFGVLLLPVGLGLIFIIYAILDKRTRVYTHTNRKVMARVGIISRKTHEVAIRDIRSINMNQGIIERIFGLGSIRIGSAGTGGVEVEFKGVTNPGSIRDAVRETKDEVDG
jgi:membrane protein YdbS with pleckstrin-like domain